MGAPTNLLAGEQIAAPIANRIDSIWSDTSLTAQSQERGVPTLIPARRCVMFHSENGASGMEPPPLAALRQNRGVVYGTIDGIDEVS